MTGSSVSGVRPPPASHLGSARGTGRSEPSQHDLKAMADAFAAAGKRQPPPQQQPATALLKQAKADAKQQAEAAAKGGQGAADDLGLTEETVSRREQGQDQSAANGFALAGQSAQGAPIQLPQAPAPHVDAAAFAELMAQLWTRENGKGSKEVRVQFGSATWPATGARLVENAAGTLDVQIYVAGGAGPNDDLDGLRERFADRGIALGALSFGDEPA